MQIDIPINRCKCGNYPEIEEVELEYLGGRICHHIICSCGREGAPALSQFAAIRNWNNGDITEYEPRRSEA